VSQSKVDNLAYWLISACALSGRSSFDEVHLKYAICIAAVRKFSFILAHLPIELKREIFLRSVTGTWSPSGPEFTQAGPRGVTFSPVFKMSLESDSKEIQFLRSGKH
jgi:hypothetical protein